MELSFLARLHAPFQHAVCAHVRLAHDDVKTILLFAALWLIAQGWGGEECRQNNNKANGRKLDRDSGTMNYAQQSEASRKFKEKNVCKYLID